MKRWLFAAALAAIPGVAAAQDDDRFCPNRPSIGESACTTRPGQVQLEISALDWERRDRSDQREDTVLIGDFQARVGLADTTELQIGWTPYGHVRTRDKLAGTIDRAGRVGDLTLGLRQNLHNPDGKGLSFGIEPSVTLPIGREPVGQGTWSAGLVAPLTYDLSEKLNLALTSEIDAAADTDGAGRHFAAAETIGLNYELSDAVTVTGEVRVLRDNDPDAHVTEALAAGSLAWQPRKRVQLWALAGTGLNHAAPDVRALTGASFLF